MPTTTSRSSGAPRTRWAIFRRVRLGGVVAEPLSAAAVRDIVKKRCALARLEGDFSAHSLRSGFVAEAGRQRLALGDTMALTGHRSTASLVGYFRQEAAHNPTARLLDGPPDRFPARHAASNPELK